jgi:hypothetical protein
VLVLPVVEEPASPVPALRLVKIVIARSGIVFSPMFATVRVRFVFSTSFCLLGKSALTIWTGKSPDGSSASCRSPPPQAEIPTTERATRRPIPRRLRTLWGQAVQTLSSKGAGNIPRTLPPPLQLRLSSSGGFMPSPARRLSVANGPPIP